MQSALCRLFDDAPGITALIVFNEGVLELVPQGLERLGKRVPGDVSVVAIARGASAQQVVPPLTCVAVPADEMGRQAIELLSSWDGSPVRRLLPPTVLRAASDAPPPSHKSGRRRGTAVTTGRQGAAPWHTEPALGLREGDLFGSQIGRKDLQSGAAKYNTKQRRRNAQ